MISYITITMLSFAVLILHFYILASFIAYKHIRWTALSHLILLFWWTFFNITNCAFPWLVRDEGLIIDVRHFRIIRSSRVSFINGIYLFWGSFTAHSRICRSVVTWSTHFTNEYFRLILFAYISFESIIVIAVFATYHNSCHNG